MSRSRLRHCELSQSRPSIIVKPGPHSLPAPPLIHPNQIAACDATCSIRLSPTPFPRPSSNQSCASEACGMGTRGGGGGSASRVGDWDVDIGDRWDWGSIPRLLSSACLFFCSGGCFGCCDKTVKKIGELSKTLITHDQLTVGEPFWSTTTIDVSQSDLKGCPALETATWNLDQQESESSQRLLITEPGSRHGLPESANPVAGRILWEQIREEWTEIKKLRPKVKQVREPVLSWSAAYQTVLVTNKPFPRPVPLHEVVDFFVDMWEEGGLYE